MTAALKINGLTPRAYLDKMIEDFFTKPTQPPQEAVKDYLHPHAIHTTDGKQVTPDQQAQHLAYLQQNLESMTFDLHQAVFDGEWLSERHIGRVVLKSGMVIESEVATFFHFTDGKVDRSFEVTRPMTGNDADREIHTAR